MKTIKLDTIIGLYEGKILNYYENHYIEDNDKLITKQQVEEIGVNYPNVPIHYINSITNAEGIEKYIMPVMYGSIENFCKEYKNFEDNNENLKQLCDILLKYCEGHSQGEDTKKLNEYMKKALYYKYVITIANKHGDKSNLYSPELTSMIYKVTGNYYQNNKTNVKKYAKILAETIENEEDLKQLTQYYENNYKEDIYSYHEREWSFCIWSKALKNIIKEGNTFSILPNFLMTRYNNVTNEVDRYECIQALEKIDFNLTKPYMEQLFKKSTNHKYVLIAKKILEHNNALKKEKVEIEHINLIEQESHIKLYESTYKIKTDILLSIVDNNNALMPNIIEYDIIKYIVKNSNNIYNIEINWLQDNEYVVIILQTKNEHYPEQFQQELNQLLKLVFNEDFLNQEIVINNIQSTIIDFLKDTKKINEHEIKKYLYKYFEKSLLKNKLEKNLNNQIKNDKNDKVVKKEIKKI